MRCIWALESGRKATAAACYAQHPELARIGHRLEGSGPWLGKEVDGLREMVVRLARDAAVKDMQDLQSALPDLPPGVVAVRRQSVMQRLCRPSKGRTNALAAVGLVGGRVTSDRAEMAEALREHWAAKFAPKHIAPAIRQQWLAEQFAPDRAGHREPLAADPRWRPSRGALRRAIAQSVDSAPGPDGVPYAAWRRLGRLVEAKLFPARPVGVLPGLLLRCRGSGVQPRDVGAAAEVTVWGVDPTAADFFHPGDTWPPAIVNTDGRLLSEALRRVLESVLAPWVSPEQRVPSPPEHPRECRGCGGGLLRTRSHGSPRGGGLLRLQGRLPIVWPLVPLRDVVCLGIARDPGALPPDRSVPSWWAEAPSRALGRERDKAVHCRRCSSQWRAMSSCDASRGWHRRLSCGRTRTT